MVVLKFVLFFTCFSWPIKSQLVLFSHESVAGSWCAVHNGNIVMHSGPGLWA